jgi:voltage-gated potassium channel
MLTKIANSPRALVVTALVLLITSSAAYAITEHKAVGESLYWALITATTVGYGDTFPKTGPGKVVAIVLVFSMVLFFLPMVTASMASKLIVNRDAFTHEEQEELKDGIRKLLAAIEVDRVARADEAGSAEGRPL